MVRAAAILTWLAAASACGGGHSSSAIDATGGGGDGTGGGGAGLSVSYGQPAILFSLDKGVIYRFDDVSGDGDYNEPGERTMFADANAANVQLGNFVATDKSTLLATGASGTVVMLHDVDGNGNALGTGEQTVWWDGSLTGGGTSLYTSGFTLSSSGAVYVVCTVAAGDHRVYKLQDTNGDGDATDAGEALEIGALPSGTSSYSIAVDLNDDLWFADISTSDLYRMRGGVASVVFTASALAQVGFQNDSKRIVVGSDGAIFISGATPPQRTQPRLLARLHDDNGDHEITANEITLVWHFSLAIVDTDYGCSFDDLVALGDGSLVALDSSHFVYRFVDGNGNESLEDNGEIYPAYDWTFAQAHGETATYASYIAAVLR